MSLLALALTYFRRRVLLTLSALCIALGVAVLYAVLAVVNGFLSELETTMREFGGDMVVKSPRSAVEEVESFLSVIEGVPGVVTAAPRVNWFGLVGRRGTRTMDDPRSADLSGLLLVGVDPELEGKSVDDSKRDHALVGKLTFAELDQLLHPGADGMPRIVLGDGAAENFGVKPGDQLGVISFRPTRPGTSSLVRQDFYVAGTFDTGHYEQDMDRALVRREDLKRFAGLTGGFTEIAVRIEAKADPETMATAVDQALVAAGLGSTSFPSAFSWREQRSNLLAAVENQKGILGVIFFFIVLVAAFQLLATLTLTVTEKRRDIGILGALGAPPRKIARFFVSLGLVTGVSGLGLGLILGVILTHNLETIDYWISGGEGIFQANTYIFDEIPVAVDTGSVLTLVASTLAAALLFSLIPAWRASRRPIIKALNAA